MSGIVCIAVINFYAIYLRNESTSVEMIVLSN